MVDVDVVVDVVDVVVVCRSVDCRHETPQISQRI
jgi:hypothetical protein